MVRTAVAVALSLYAGAEFSIRVQAAGSSHRDASPPLRSASRFTLDQARVADAVRQVSSATKLEVTLRLPRGHPAFSRRVSLAMQWTAHDDLLSTISCAYGLRWLWVEPGLRAALVDKQDYRSRPEGLRQGTSDALPDDLRADFLVARQSVLGAAETHLKALTEEQLQRLEAACAQGPVPLNRLDAEFVRPLDRYLRAYRTAILRMACDEYWRDLALTATSPVHYGMNPGGNTQFTFRLGRAWIAVKPD